MSAGSATGARARVLVVDDEPGIRQALGQLLEYEGYAVRTAAGGEEGIAQYGAFRPHLVFLDVKMARVDGMETLGRLRQQDPQATVVMISGHATLQTAVEATQRGAYDILEKPLDTDRVLVVLRNALASRALTEENARLREAIGALTAALGGLDALVFTGGIGEHDALTRHETVAGLGFLGLALDEAANATHGAGRGGLISASGAAARVWVIPTDEEAEIARHLAITAAAAPRRP